MTHPTQPTPDATAVPLTQLKVLAAALMGGVVMMGVVAFLVLDTAGYPPVWVPTGLGLLAVAAHVACEAIGYRGPALAPGTPPAQAAAAGLAAYRASMLLRFGLCESVAVAALVAAFAASPQTARTYLVGGTLSLALLAWHTWPSARGTRRLQAHLDREGGASHLADTLHGRPGGSTGPHAF